MLGLLVFGHGQLLLTFWPRLIYGLSLLRRTTLVLGLTLLVASTIHVWYVSWLLVLLPLVWQDDDWRTWDFAWLLFAITAELPYLIHAFNGNTPLFQWIRPLEFCPLNPLVMWNIFQVWRQERRKLVPAVGFPAKKRKAFLRKFIL